MRKIVLTPSSLRIQGIESDSNSSSPRELGKGASSVKSANSESGLSFSQLVEKQDVALSNFS